MALKKKIHNVILWIKHYLDYWFQQRINTPDESNTISDQIMIYQDDTIPTSGCYVSSVARDNGTTIVVCSGGKVVQIKDDIETEVLLVDGATDWRGLWKDSRGNIFVSPHSTPILGSIKMKDRGIYKLATGASRFIKVQALYNPKSPVKSETEENDDTVWTFCEDGDGNLYAGIYAHTKRCNPSIYKSTDNGDSWVKIYDFNESGLTTGGRHIHAITYSKEEAALYALVGEVNNLFKSKDGGYTWYSLNIKLELAKGCTMYPVRDGIVIGSDSAYDCIMSKYYFKTNKVRTTSRTFGGTVFSIRQSDKTGWLYAFGKVDSSVVSPFYYPPIEAEQDNRLIKEWRKEYPNAYREWYFYHKRMQTKFPEDAIHPQHCAILLSKDEGDTWSIVKKVKTSALGPNGFWTTGYFHNGKCLTGFVDGSIKYTNPFIIEETDVDIK